MSLKLKILGNGRRGGVEEKMGAEGQCSLPKRAGSQRSCVPFSVSSPILGHYSKDVSQMNRCNWYYLGLNLAVSMVSIILQQMRNPMRPTTSSVGRQFEDH
jgi:hypothetical protein